MADDFDDVYADERAGGIKCGGGDDVVDCAGGHVVVSRVVM